MRCRRRNAVFCLNLDVARVVKGAYPSYKVVLGTVPEALSWGLLPPSDRAVHAQAGRKAGLYVDVSP